MGVHEGSILAVRGTSKGADQSKFLVLFVVAVLHADNERVARVC